MGRTRIFINTSIYPDDVIETLARIFYDDIIKDLNNDEDEICISSEYPEDCTAETLDIAT